MADEELEQTLKKIFGRVLKVDPSTIRSDTSLREELHITSLQLLDLALEIEETLEIRMENIAVLRMHKFSDVVREVKATINGR